MGRALVSGAIDAGAVAPADVTAFDVVPAAVEALRDAHPVTAAESLAEVIAASEVLLVCTKPHDVAAVLKQVAAAGPSARDTLVISVAAGLTVQALERPLGGQARVIRCMPNTPALVGQGAAAFTRGSTATDADAEVAQRLLGAVGTAIEVPERLIDAVTGLSGSGPAYIYILIEALADGGVLNGLPRPQALELAAKTVAGAAAMVLGTGEHPASLKDMVASPGGTTIAGLKALEDSGFRAACINAVTAATERARELGQQ